MSPSHEDALLILAAGYDNISKAVADFDAVSALYKESDAAGYFDAAVFNPNDPDIKSRVVRQLEPSQRGATGAHVKGLASRMAHHIFEGLALVGGAAGGGDQDLPSSSADAIPGLGADDRTKLGAVQKAASDVLIVIFQSHMAELIAATIKAANSYTSKEIHESAEELEGQIIEAEQKSIAHHQR